jgi:hypothetical protein
VQKLILFTAATGYNDCFVVVLLVVLIFYPLVIRVLKSLFVPCSGTFCAFLWNKSICALSWHIFLSYPVILKSKSIFVPCCGTFCALLSCGTYVLFICKVKTRHFKTDSTETVALCFGYPKTPCLRADGSCLPEQMNRPIVFCSLLRNIAIVKNCKSRNAIKVFSRRLMNERIFSLVVTVKSIIWQ